MSEEFVYFTCFIFFMIWVVSKSPALRWFAMFLVMAGWGVMAVGAPLFVALAIHAPKGNYIAAVATAVLGLAALGSFWIAYGWPSLCETCKDFKGSMRLWDGN